MRHLMTNVAVLSSSSDDVLNSNLTDSLVETVAVARAVEIFEHLNIYNEKPACHQPARTPTNPWLIMVEGVVQRHHLHLNIS